MADTEQTRLIRDSAAAFVRRSDGLKIARDSRCRDGLTPLHSVMAESGWLGMLVPEDDGGYGGRFSDMAALCEELAKGLAEMPVLRTGVFGCRSLVHAPPSATRTRLLERLVAGELHLGVAWHGGELQMTDDAGSITSGRLEHVTCDSAVDGVVALAVSQGNHALVLLPFEGAKLTVEREWLVDGTPAVSLTVPGSGIDAVEVLATGEAARNAFQTARLEATVMASAALLGVMSASFELTRSYLCTRVQFGKPIGSFQALAHRSVDQYVQQQLARDVLAQAIEALDAQSGLRSPAVVHRAKARCSDAAMKITRESIQMHGAIGFTDEYDAGLFLKRAIVLNAWLGNSAYHRRCYNNLDKETA